MLTSLFLGFLSGTAALTLPLGPTEQPGALAARSCRHSATNRGCWGDYSINTNYYDTYPTTGVVREYWLTLEEVPCTPDGVQTTCMAFNGTVPGPAITADWGDTLVVHVTNNLRTNGTSVHWHGLRQLQNFLQDGVPGVTQCPIPSGGSQTYKMHLTEYGSTWYHSHWSLQYGSGAFGALNINGPATLDYDEDLGTVFMQDWSHTDVFTLWRTTAETGTPPTLENGLINGMNTYGNLGKKAEFVFEAGKKYRMRIVNVALAGHFKFSIDNHNFHVIANDLVPVVPFKTKAIRVSIGQRYDIIVHANNTDGNYWMRAGWQNSCDTIENPEKITAIVRYNKHDKSDPTSQSSVYIGANCNDWKSSDLVPHVALDVPTTGLETIDEKLQFDIGAGSLFHWTFKNSSFLIDWGNPSSLLVAAETAAVLPTNYNSVSINRKKKKDDQWAVLLIEDQSHIGISHPIHLHGHDFWVLSQSHTAWDGTMKGWQFTNPPRRDVATLHGNGYLAIAFKLDNPGIWLVHCHIAWHASQGLAMQIVEDAAKIKFPVKTVAAQEAQCAAWATYTATEVFAQDDSGI